MATIQTNVGSPGTVGGASGGVIFAFNNISTTPQVVMPVDAQRTLLTFHNPGSVDILVGPSFVQTTGSDVALVPTISALGGCFRVFANGGTLTITGECQKAWQAFSASGTTNPLTVMASRI